MREPDFESLYGKAWKCDTAEGRRLRGTSVESDATLVHWVIYAPWAHPMWGFYSLVIVHLRPMPGKEPKIHLPGATHEMWLVALNPEKDVEKLVDTGIVEGHWLSPMNFAAQLIEPSDESALARIELAVRDICEARLSPDTDYRHQWIRRFGGNMIKRS